MTLEKNAFDKWNKAGKQHFLLFPQCFLPNEGQKYSLLQNHFFGLQMSANDLNMVE